MKISNSTGKSKDFYNRGKAMFDQIPPVTQAIPQIPQERSSKYMTVFELIEVNGLTLHGDIEHFAALVAAAEREACAKLCDWYVDSSSDHEAGTAMNIQDAIRARGQA
jgi:hypothetical protein